MIKDIKDYLHLYLGCECRCYSLSDRNGWIDRVTPELLIQIDDEDSGINGLCLLLRPLSDMTEEEGYEIYFQYFGSKTADDWSGDTGSAYFQPKKVRPGKYHGLRIVDGTDYSSGDFGTVIKILPFLLSKGFDLFGLIDAGIAIDKTKV